MDNSTANTKTRLSKIADESSSMVQSAADKISDISSRAGEGIKQGAETVALKSREVAKGVGGYVKQHPVATAGVIIAAGLLLGKLLKQRNYF